MTTVSQPPRFRKLCACGHSHLMHRYGLGACEGLYTALDDGIGGPCDCLTFQEAQ